MGAMKIIVVTMGLLAFATCLSALASNQSVKEVTEQAYIAAVAVGDAPAACRDSIGKDAALVLVRYCSYVSSATHPPCYTGNHCALIVDHVRYMCHAGETETLPCSDSINPSQWESIGQRPAK